jgi:hypothetical protein
MPKVLSIIMALVVGLAFTSSAVAKAGAASQPARKQAKWANPQHLYNKLTGLTDKQKADIKAIDKQAKLDAGKVQTKEEKQKIWKAADEKIRTTVLTADQCKQLEELEHGKAVKHHKVSPGEQTGAKHS